MDQIQATAPNSVLPHIVHVHQTSVAETKLQSPQIIRISYPPIAPQPTLSYQPSLTDSIQIPPSNVAHGVHRQDNTTQNLVMSCQQSHMEMQQSLTQLQPAVMEGNHMIQTPIVLSRVHQQYYGQYEYKIEPEMIEHMNKTVECKSGEVAMVVGVTSLKKRRGDSRDPSLWACNVRKLKHQRGEAYVNRRGKYVPQKQIKNIKDCLNSCKYKCNEKVNDTDRENIFKAFYSLNGNEKRHFLLNTTERHYAKSKLAEVEQKRKYSYKYFFLVRAVRHMVCKNFYLGTLAISQKPVYNVHLGKSEVNTPKPDGRGLSRASVHSLPAEVKDRVRRHILTFTTVDSKPIKQFSKKKQYLGSNLNIKYMYTLYTSECRKDEATPVKEYMYRKIFNREFNVQFKKSKSEPVCCKCKGAIKKK